MYKILDDTYVTITLSTVLPLSFELQCYLQRATIAEARPDPTIIEVNSTTQDSDAVVKHLQLEEHKLTKVIVDGGSGVYVMSNHLQKHLALSQLRNAQFILCMVKDTLVTPMGILPMVGVTTHGVSTPTTFVVIDIPQSNTFPIILGRRWLIDMNAISDRSRN